MAWFNQSQSQKSEYTYVAEIEVDYGFGYATDKKIPKLFSMRANADLGFKFAKKLFKKLIDNIDDNALVDFKIDYENGVYDPAKMHCGKARLKEYYCFYILTEDIDKIDSEPIHIACVAEEYPDEKADFINIIRAFSR